VFSSEPLAIRRRTASGEPPRLALPLRAWYGVTVYVKTPQWLVDCEDIRTGDVFTVPAAAIRKAQTDKDVSR
jgi:hypothetical protein